MQNPLLRVLSDEALSSDNAVGDVSQFDYSVSVSREIAILQVTICRILFGTVGLFVIVTADSESSRYKSAGFLFSLFQFSVSCVGVC